MRTDHPEAPGASPQAEYLSQSYFPQLDGLRAISVLLVISVHLYAAQYWSWLAGGYGVVVFFVLSGYLITTLALREEARSGRVSLVAFYLRRCCDCFRSTIWSWASTALISIMYGCMIPQLLDNHRVAA